MKDAISVASIQTQSPEADQDPLVSVVLPTFNRGSKITQAIDSVLHQSYTNLELIVVDDGSTDDTPSIISAYQDPRIRLIRFSENRGANAARNAGIMAAKGEYVAFQDSDDEWDCQKLRLQISGCIDCRASVAFCSLDRRQKNSSRVIPKPGYRIPQGLNDLSAHVLRGSFVSCQTLVVNRQFLIDAGLFDEKIPRLQDWEIAIRMAFRKAFLFLPQPLVTATIGDDSISANSSALVESANMIYHKHVEKFQRDRAAGAILFFNTAMGFGITRHPVIAIKLVSKGLKAGGFSGSVNALKILMHRR